MGLDTWEDDLNTQKDALSYEEYLNIYGRLIYSNVGVSMMPLLWQGRDLFIVEKKNRSRCKAGDVVLYRRPPDQYVLHRIVEVLPDSYVILGDNCIAKEYDISDKGIIGVMTGFVRDGREHSIEEKGYRFYTALWMHTIPLRVFLKKCSFRLSRGIKKQSSP